MPDISLKLRIWLNLELKFCDFSLISSFRRNRSHMLVISYSPTLKLKQNSENLYLPNEEDITDRGRFNNNVFKFNSHNDEICSNGDLYMTLT